MKVALVSLNQSWEDKEANRLKVRNCFQTIAFRNMDLVIFPEMTLTGFTMNVKEHAEEAENSATIRFFTDCACYCFSGGGNVCGLYQNSSLFLCRGGSVL